MRPLDPDEGPRCFSDRPEATLLFTLSQSPTPLGGNRTAVTAVVPLNLCRTRSLALFSSLTSASGIVDPIERYDIPHLDRARSGFRGGPGSPAAPRGEDAEAIMEAIEVAGVVGIRVGLARPVAGVSAAERPVPAASDQAAARSVPDGGPGLRALPATVLRIPPDLLAPVPGRLGLPLAGRAERRGGVPEAQARPGSRVSATG